MALGRTFAAAAAVLVVGTVAALAQAPGRWVTDKFAPLPDPEDSPANEVFEFNLSSGSR